jgi:hypothetical protein
VKHAIDYDGFIMDSIENSVRKYGSEQLAKSLVEELADVRVPLQLHD